MSDTRISPSDKRMEAARSLLKGILAPDFPTEAEIREVATALANAEREGMKRAAEIARTAGHWEAAKYDGSPWPATGAVWRGLDANQIADKILSESERA